MKGAEYSANHPTRTLTEQDLNNLRSYLNFIESNHTKIYSRLIDAYQNDLTRGDIAKSIASEERLMFLKEASDSNNWSAYTDYLNSRGATYVATGISFLEWFDVMTTYRNLTQEVILEVFGGNTEKTTQVLGGLNFLFDYSIKAISDAFFQATNERISKESQTKAAILNQLTESEQRFRALFENSSDHIYVIDVDGKIEYINHTTEGLDIEDVVGSNLFDYQTGESRQKEIDAVHNVIRTGKPASYESEIASRKGKIQHFSGSVAPIFKDNKVCKVAIIARNITEKVKAQGLINELNQNLEKKVEERTAELREAIDELESFSYSVSHDLRAPIRAIGGFGQVLKKKLDGRLDESEQHYLNVILENTDKMGHLIDDLLAFSRMGRQEKQTSSFDMNQVVEQAIKDLTLGQDTSHITFNITPLPSVRADREMIKLAITNLIGNALKFSSPRDQIIIDIDAEEDENSVLYRIKDNGVGFEMEYAHKLFGIFQRLHTDDEFEGTGVGLAIVHRIISRHGGKVGANSALNNGATFYFSLPKKGHHE